MLEIIQRLTEVDPKRGLFFHEDFSDAPELIPYNTFPARVLGCAEHFRAQGIGPGDRVIFPFESSEDVLFALFGLMQVGALPLSVKPYILSTPKQGYREFLTRISNRYGAKKLLAVPSLASIELPLERVSLAPRGAKGEGALRTPGRDELAFVQFSSGSTSFPKGVPITQGKLAAHLEIIASHDGRTGETRGSSWLPLYHDMGLIGLLTCFLHGHDAFITQPQSFLIDPLGWWQFMSRERINLSVIPNFAIDYSLKRLAELPEEDLAELDLAPMQTVYLGSEPINIANLERFCALLAPRGLKREVFMPCYGMAEAVLMVSCAGKGSDRQTTVAPNGQPAISVGRPRPEFEVRLRAEGGELCGDGELGEVEIRGGTLASSYFEDDRPLISSDGFFHTGDLGFLKNDELFITGRINDRIKINGQSFFSSDFEQAIERLPFIREGRSAVLQLQGRLKVLAEVTHAGVLETRFRTQQQVCEAVLTTVGVPIAPEDVLFIRYGQIQKTSSGKLQRVAMAEALERGQIEEASPMQLRVDGLKMNAKRLFYGSLLAAQKRVRGVLGAKRGPSA